MAATFRVFALGLLLDVHPQFGDVMLALCAAVVIIAGGLLYLLHRGHEE